MKSEFTRILGVCEAPEEMVSITKRYMSKILPPDNEMKLLVAIRNRKRREKRKPRKTVIK